MCSATGQDILLVRACVIFTYFAHASRITIRSQDHQICRSESRTKPWNVGEIMGGNIESSISRHERVFPTKH